MKKFLCRFGILLCLLLTASGLFAQTGNTAALSGTVTDPTGAVVPNVSITATNTGTNQSRTVTSGADGTYKIPLLEPGTYRLRFTAQGFKTSDVTGITLSVTEIVNMDRALEVGAQAEQVTVEANVETVQTATSTLGTTVTAQTITALPLSTRNFTQVLGMSAGVAVDVANAATFGRGSQNMSVNGADPRKNNFQMDGVSINNAAGGNSAGDAGLYTGIAIPNPDALQEFKVQTSTYDASFGRNPGANVNVVTKSGTNQFHGSLFEYFRNEALNANDFFYNRDSKLSQTQKQVLKNNQFGGTIGGPIKKDKLFFFGSFQGTRQRNGIAAQGYTSANLFPLGPEGLNRGTTSLAGVDDAAAANFRNIIRTSSCPVVAGTRGSICPTLGANGAGGVNLPINDVSMRLMQVKLADGSYYIPTSGTSGTLQRLYSIPGKYSENQYLANVDYNITSSHTIQARYMFSDNPFVYVGSGNFGQLPGRVQTDKRANTSALLRLTSILSPTVVNQARGSFQRVIQDGSDVLPYTPQQVGITPLVSLAGSGGTTGGDYVQPPPISITGAFAVGGGLNPAFAPSNQTQWSDQLSWTKGKHSFRAGFEFENVRYPLVFGGLGRGQLVMASFGDFLVGRAGCASGVGCTAATPGASTGQTLSSFNTCVFCVRSRSNGIIHNYNLRNFNAYVQDDWKVSDRLTVNVGVRWEYNGILRDKYGNLTNFWKDEVGKINASNIPSATSVDNAILTLGANANAFTGYVLPSNYDTRPLSQGGWGAVPPGAKVNDSQFSAQNGVPLSNFAPRIGFAWTPTGSSRFVIRGGAGLFYDRMGINDMVHAVQEGRPYADTTGIQNDVASLASPYQKRPLQLLPRWYNFNTLSGSAFNSPFYDKIHTPLVRQYNLGIQYEFLRSYVLEVAYVGSSGITLGNYNHIINTARLVCTARVTSNCVNGFVNNPLITTNTAANAHARVPYLGFLANGFEQNGFDGVSNYNSMQATVRKNFTKDLGFQASYTWSKNLSNIGYLGANLNDPTDMWQQYGQAPFSRPQRFVLSYQYALPYKEGGSILSRVLGGWSASGLTTIQSGTPLTIFDGRGGAVYGLAHSNAIEDNVTRAQFAPGITFNDLASAGDLKARLGGNSGGNGFFNKAAFVAPPILGDDNSLGFGNSGVGVIRSPHQLNFDFSVRKSFRVREGQTLQLTSDFFNVFNHAQFQLQNGTAGAQGVNNGQTQSNSALFGQITSTAVAPRIIQFALRYQF